MDVPWITSNVRESHRISHESHRMSLESQWIPIESHRMSHESHQMSRESHRMSRDWVRSRESECISFTLDHVYSSPVSRHRITLGRRQGHSVLYIRLYSVCIASCYSNPYNPGTTTVIPRSRSTSISNNSWPSHAWNPIDLSDTSAILCWRSAEWSSDGPRSENMNVQPSIIIF